MYFPYGVWRDAGREARRMPPSNGNDSGAVLFTLFIGSLLVYSCFSAGGYGILFGICIIVGILQSLNK